jgi:hypothetical protein
VVIGGSVAVIFHFSDVLSTPFTNDRSLFLFFLFSRLVSLERVLLDAFSLTK